MRLSRAYREWFPRHLILEYRFQKTVSEHMGTLLAGYCEQRQHSKTNRNEYYGFLSRISRIRSQPELQITLIPLILLKLQVGIQRFHRRRNVVIEELSGFAYMCSHVLVYYKSLNPTYNMSL